MKFRDEFEKLVWGQTYAAASARGSVNPSALADEGVEEFRKRVPDTIINAMPSKPVPPPNREIREDRLPEKHNP